MYPLIHFVTSSSTSVTANFNLFIVHHPIVLQQLIILLHSSPNHHAQVGALWLFIWKFLVVIGAHVIMLFGSSWSSRYHALLLLPSSYHSLCSIAIPVFGSS
ncbi:hypothetical protein L1987_00987 [Smallanthus sonchifolius]|uniref:Uncharacterized protein n=1 Tax=Smallanthus sonchifolius TaxID=185202 RepID=A0ACB9K3U9_9ASTR|nr:hypothetical protein L1987_00987 [Smallanthus sonchifolius]